MHGNIFFLHILSGHYRNGKSRWRKMTRKVMEMHITGIICLTSLTELVYYNHSLTCHKSCDLLIPLSAVIRTYYSLTFPLYLKKTMKSKLSMIPSTMAFWDNMTSECLGEQLRHSHQGQHC